MMIFFRFLFASKIILFAIILAVFSNNLSAQGRIVYPYETSGSIETPQPAGTIDRLILGKLRKEGITPANLCSDEVFVRRAFLDVIGTLPEVGQVKAFLEDKTPNKRAKLIDKLLKQDEFADYWSLKWCDVLRVKAEFPINLWPNAVQAYHRWIHDAIAENMPYDEFVRSMLTSSGSNFRQAEVNFYRAVQGRQPQAIAKAAALTFMGVRLEKFTEKQQQDMEALFCGIAYKPTAEWKEEIVCCDPNFNQSAEITFPDGKQVTIAAGEDRRKVFADWLITSRNPYFSRNIVNRIWYWLNGMALIGSEVDDVGLEEKGANPELLNYLEKELVKSRYDLKHIYRLILNSRTYQQSSIPQSKNPDAKKMFAFYPVRQLEAEVLIDAICKVTGTNESYSSPIPEPFSFIPEYNRSIDLADGSTTSQFLEMFGRPSRDSGLESERNNQPTDAQRLHMINSSHIQNKIDQGWRLREIIAKNQRNMVVDTIYLTILSRYPTDEEKATFIKYVANKFARKQAVNDLVWALMNSKEFLYRH